MKRVLNLMLCLMQRLQMYLRCCWTMQRTKPKLKERAAGQELI